MIAAKLGLPVNSVLAWAIARGIKDHLGMGTNADAELRNFLRAEILDELHKS